MLLAHAPAGYLLTRILARTIFKKYVVPERSNKRYQLMMIAGLVGGILPDFDIMYQFFWDPYKTSHHAYITHMPIFWIGLLVFLTGCGVRLKNRMFIILSVTGCLSAMLHLVCDTLTGVIYWLYPFSDRSFNVLSVAEVQVWWVQKYIYHWTFLVELAIIFSAGILFLRIKETVVGIQSLVKHSETFRIVSIRLGVCIIGIMVLALVGSLKFDIDNRIAKKIVEFKLQMVLKHFSS